MSSTPDNMDDTRAKKTRSGRSLRRSSPSLHTRSSSPMGDKTDDKNESSHPMTDNEDDPSHMGDDNDQHDEHDNNDDNTQAIATCTQAQLASLVEHAVSNATSQERTKFQFQITSLETFHNEEVANVRSDLLVKRRLPDSLRNCCRRSPPNVARHDAALRHSKAITPLGLSTRRHSSSSRCGS